MGHGPSVLVFGHRADFSLHPIAKGRKRLARSGAKGLLLLGCVDLRKPDLDRPLILEHGQGVAVRDADNRG